MWLLIHFVFCLQGEKPFKCSYCDHRTALRGNCNQHIRKYHPNQKVVVIDLHADQRRPTKPYNYASFSGDNITLTTEDAVPVGCTSRPGSPRNMSGFGENSRVAASPKNSRTRGVKVTGKAIIQSLDSPAVSAGDCQIPALSSWLQQQEQGEAE